MAQYEMPDDRRADAVWRRVSPDLDPYPDARRQSQEESARRQDPPFVRPPAADSPRRPTKDITQAEAITAAIARELEERRTYQTVARRVPQPLRRAVEQLAADALRGARRLMAAYFVLTGERYRPEPVRPRSSGGNWLTELRQVYRQCLSAAEQYARWAENTDDPILADALRDLSGEKKRQARTLMGIWENALA
ncbi:MAG: hypothetical protein J5482_00455 [Oscillospiraceae bacterium]|nr:hypothetical protein [Oscillospiraceae bacterium]